MKDILNISSLITSQLPNFILDDDNYSTFVSFIEAYYEWMEQTKGVYLESKNLIDYIDVDKTVDEFIDHFYNEFMPSFPKDIIADKRKLLKYSRSLYESKGTPASFKFLFKILYNSDCEIIDSGTFVLKTSDGQWFLPKSIKIKSVDERFLLTDNLFVLGEDSKTLAKIERAKIVSNKIEIFVSDIQRLFNVGEYIRIVDSNIKDIYFDEFGNIVTSDTGELLRAKISSSISSVYVGNRGQYYNSGNPVVFYDGGLPPSGNNFGGAVAVIGDVTAGFITKAAVDTTSSNWGYRNYYTAVYIDPDPDKKTIIQVSSVDTNSAPINVSNIIMNSLVYNQNDILYCDTHTGFTTNVSANYSHFGTLTNANTVMSDVFEFDSFDTYPLQSLLVQYGGGGFASQPKVLAETVYETDDYIDVTQPYDIRYVFDNTATPMVYATLPLLGILGPVLVSSNNVTGKVYCGSGYKVGDELSFLGTYGTAAFANVTSVYANGGIISVSYYQKPEIQAPAGGFGYTNDNLPTVGFKSNIETANVHSNSNVIKINSSNVSSNIIVGRTISGNGIPANTKVIGIYYSNNSIIISNNATGNYTSNVYGFTGTGASLYVDGILGGSARITPYSTKIGAVSSIKIENYGDDYTATPNVSLKIQDFVVSNVNILHPPQQGDIVYQGSLGTLGNYFSYVDSISEPVVLNADPTQTKYILRTYNYNFPVNVDLPLTLEKIGLRSPNTYSLVIDSSYVFPAGYYGITQSATGVVSYGDGTATATCKFLNGLILGQGRYLTEQGQPSSYSVMQNDNYNNYTYTVSVEKEISKYRQILYDLLHPAGTHVIGQAVIKSHPNEPATIKESNFSNSLFTDYEFIFFALGAEANSIIHQPSDGILEFDLSVEKYGTFLSNNVIKIYPFPGNVNVGQEISGTGIEEYTLIEEIYLSNNRIKVSNVCTATLNSVPLTINYVNGFPIESNMKPLLISCNGNIIFNSNIIEIIPDYTNILSGISKGQNITAEPILLSGNTVSGNNIMTKITASKNVVIGQTISGEYVPYGTTVVNYDKNNKLIYMSNNATGYSNSTYAFVKYYNPTVFLAQTTTGSNLLTNVITFDRPLIVGQAFVSGDYIPDGTYIIAYYEANATVQMSNYATGNSSGDALSYITSNSEVYSINTYNHLYNVPDSTQVSYINTPNNTIIVSSNCFGDPQSNKFYFSANASSILTSNNYMMIRTEPGTLPERSK